MHFYHIVVKEVYVIATSSYDLCPVEMCFCFVVFLKQLCPGFMPGRDVFLPCSLLETALRPCQLLLLAVIMLEALVG